MSEVAEDRARLKARQDELEKVLVAAPAETWADAVEKARYLLSLFAATAEAEDPRRKTLIKHLLEDFERLLVGDGHAAGSRRDVEDAEDTAKGGRTGLPRPL